MATEYSVALIKRLENKYQALQLHRPMEVNRYDANDTLSYEMTAIEDETKKAVVDLSIIKFIGGGFAGQVYKVRVTAVTGNAIETIRVGQVYAMKILIPPSHGSLFFRNLLYGIGFQGAFQLQVNPAAARSGALWQKFIKRGAEICFDDTRAVNDIHATFVDHTLGSCGELSNWIDGRTWQLEVDDHVDLLGKWNRGKTVDESRLGSPEFRTKKQFMKKFVKLLHDMGAYEFARQYEWSTWKSQPNCLKRTETDNDPYSGLIAVDFRAGLALLPFLPMSPGDIKLIVQGFGRGSVVQFDRGSLSKLELFINKHEHAFADMRCMLQELKKNEGMYRNSVPDITHNHVRLLYSKTLWSTMISSTITGWRVKNLMDNDVEQRFRKSFFLPFIFFLIGLIPFLGRVVRKAWARKDWRNHYRTLLTNIPYFKRSVNGKMIEKAISLHRAERVDEARALKVVSSMAAYMMHVPLSILPVGMHKFLSNWDYCKERLDYIFRRPLRLYFNADEREKWFRDMVEEGVSKRIIKKEDADEIRSQINEPYIQKYLKSLAVHVCTVPITQVVSVTIAALYVLKHPQLSWEQAVASAMAIIAAFQVVPISPGSLTRGLYVLYLVIRERNFKDYNIAVFLGFFKYIGYLAFPIQMAYRYPTIARFMAGYWSTEAVHVVPVFGEEGALLEHTVYNMFYNWPLTIRRRITERIQQRAMLKPRYWHVVVYAVIVAASFGIAEYMYFVRNDALPGLKNIAILTILLPFVGGALVALGGGGASIAKRIIAAALCGSVSAVLYATVTLGISSFVHTDIVLSQMIYETVWRVFVFTIFFSIGAVLTELRL